MNKKVAMHFSMDILPKMVLVCLFSVPIVSASTDPDCWDFCVPYTGSINRTRSGRRCQRWTEQFPQRHYFTNSSFFPDESIEAAENFCRDPNNGLYKPFCYTMDPNLRWEYCLIPLCYGIYPERKQFPAEEQISCYNSPIYKWAQHIQKQYKITGTTQLFECDDYRCYIDRSSCPGYDPCLHDGICDEATQSPNLALALGIVIGVMVLFTIIGAAWLFALRVAFRREKKMEHEAAAEQQQNSGDGVNTISDKVGSDQNPPPSYTEVPEGESSEVSKRPLAEKGKNELKEQELIGAYLKEVF